MSNISRPAAAFHTHVLPRPSLSQPVDQSPVMSNSPALAALQEAFPADQVALPDSELYDGRNASYLSLLESEIAPSAIVLPKSKAEVAAFLKIVGEHKQHFAVRGAGQQPLPGCANAKDGITLDLANLVGVELKDGIVSIGAGERWGAVYNKLHDEGLSVTGARSGNNGVGGLALSGRLRLSPSFLPLFLKRRH
jgi:FAD/FMN-containing dehydrogenase